jgi:large subunit ribosomal protein L32e
MLELRSQIKKKKPKFARQDNNKTGINSKWRKPRGIDSKLRLCLRGHAKKVSPGYGSPKAVKGLHKSGLIVAMISCLNDLDSINKEKEGAVIKGSVGLRKKVELAKKAKEKGIKILNMKDIDNFLKDVSEKLEKRKQVKKKIAEKKEKAVKEAKEKTKKKEAEQLADKVKTDEEKKEEEKKEKDKVLTQKA